MIKIMKKFWIVLGCAVCSLLVALVWELGFVKHADEKQGGLLQHYLTREEERVDELLREIDTRSVNFTFPWKEKGTVLVVYHAGKLVYWSDEQVGVRGLYRKLKSDTVFQRINNVYYDVRSYREGEDEYFGLIMVREDYPSMNKYIRNHFNPVLQIDDDCAEKVVIRDKDDDVGQLICNREGVPLFRVEDGVTPGDLHSGYWVLIMYFAFLYLFLYAYEIRLELARSFREQLLYSVLFLLLILLMRFFMITYRVPDVLYALSIFEDSNVGGVYFASVGDLFVSMFCMVHYIFITLYKLRVKEVVACLLRFRHVFMAVVVVLAFLYTNLFHFSISSLIENTAISLNIAQVMNISLASIIVFVTLIIIGLGLIVLINSSVRYFNLLFSFQRVLFEVSVVLGVCAWICYVFDLSLTPVECLFTLSLYYLFILKEYIVKEETQKTLFMLALAVLSVYVVFLSKNKEVYREFALRAKYASELIKERDPAFEEKLKEVGPVIKGSEYLSSLVVSGEEEKVRQYIVGELIDLAGFHFECDVAVRRSGLEDPVYSGRDDYEDLLSLHGIPVEGSGFYHIEQFDGIIRYLGRFVYFTPEGRSVRFYVNFESKKDYDGIGYAQILAHIPLERDYVSYPYSFAKYKRGRLIDSEGGFTYYKSITRMGEYTHVETLDKDGYSHMIIPVGNDGTFVISLNEDVFRLYYMNVFYAFLVSLLLTSYGTFFRFDAGEYTRQNSFKARIKVNMIYLIAGLFLIMTVMSIGLNSLSFEYRHKARMIELSKSVVDELKKSATIGIQEDARMGELLDKLAAMLWVDVNIYDWRGRLVATSRRSIFENGFDGLLLNPVAYQRIVREGGANFIHNKKIGEIGYKAVYMPLELVNGKKYVVNIPYFTKTDELNMDILLVVVISVNIAIVVMVLAFILSSLVADRVVKPLQLINERLRRMQVGGVNEKITYDGSDEVGALVKEYNAMVDKLADSVRKLARSERESAWREMARQIAHEIKNPLTPMKLNLQFLQRTIEHGSEEELRKRVKDVSAVLIEQIDNMASIASAFSDFAKLQVSNNELFNLSEQVANCVKLFMENVDSLEFDIMPDVFVFGDREQMNRVIVNILKNAVQSIPEGRSGHIFVCLKAEDERVTLYVRDNGSGIPESIRDRISEPNFTTKSGGTGLGLAMSYKIVESMGGEISFESEENVGTTFYVRLKKTI